MASSHAPGQPVPEYSGAGPAGLVGRWLDRITTTLMRWIEILLGVLLLLAIALNFANVVGRYVLATSIVGIDEVQVYLMVWITFVGAAAVTLRGENLRMDALVKWLPLPAARVLRIVELALTIVLAVFMVTVSSSYVRNVLGTTSSVGGIPMIIPHSSVLVGYLLILLVAVRHALAGGRL